MPQYLVKATVNYPETEVDTPDFEAESDGKLLSWMIRLLNEPDATSYVVVISKKPR